MWVTSKPFLRSYSNESRLKCGVPNFYSSKEQLVESLRALLRIADWLKSLKNRQKILRFINQIGKICLTNSHSREGFDP